MQFIELRGARGVENASDVVELLVGEGVARGGLHAVGREEPRVHSLECLGRGVAVDVARIVGAGRQCASVVALRDLQELGAVRGLQLAEYVQSGGGRQQCSNE